MPVSWSEHAFLGSLISQCEFGAVNEGSPPACAAALVFGVRRLCLADHEN